MNIAEINLIDIKECADIVKKVKSLENKWTDRRYYSDGSSVSDANPDFFSLGSAAYLDGPSAHKNNNNKLIIDHFSALIEKVIATLEETLDVKVLLDNDYSYPGFIIFRGSNNLQYGTPFGGAIHRDIPHITSEFTFKFNMERPISFTLALEMPERGGGLNYWKETEEMNNSEIISCLYSNLPRNIKVWVDTNRQYVEYTEGTLYIHDGQTLHQLANEVASSSKDYRITLQGHGVYKEEGLMIYL